MIPHIQSYWLIIYEILYVVVLVLVCLRIIYDTRSSTKTLAYMLVVIFLPVIGMIIYFSLGINYRKRKMYSKKLTEDDHMAEQLRRDIFTHSKKTFEKHRDLLQSNRELIHMLAKDGQSVLTGNNDVRLLINGEEKFPAVLEAIEQAQNHIHIEYYIFEDDAIGRAIEKLLIMKAKEGVQVRFIYDDFGSRSIRKTIVPRLKAAGVEVFPFHRIIFIALANRLNYRNHRKIIVIDGYMAFIGGINVSERYVNDPAHRNRLYWRDTHIQIKGPGVNHLQYQFLCDWNFCAGDQLQPNDTFFPAFSSLPVFGDKIVQIAASGPDSDTPTILYAMLQAINLATKEILITTPYFIPGDSILDALIVAALGGVKVKLLVPGVSDSVFVNAAAWSYYDDLLDAGVEIYLYQKGFIHAKTMVADQKVAVIGTANMDYRSFELNFEVNAIIYNAATAQELCANFHADLKHSVQIDPVEWRGRPLYKKFMEKAARLLSPLL